jgi:N-acetylmuramic acid 6-phosphate etherase
VGFDFSRNLLKRRSNQDKSIIHHIFKITYENEGLHFSLDNLSNYLSTPFRYPIFPHLILKMILNTHSTLIMGRLGRYEGNVMTYVRASNNKLIDRAIRYIDLILKTKKISLTYSDLTHILFEMIEKTPTDQSIVLATVAEIEKRCR